MPSNNHYNTLDYNGSFSMMDIQLAAVERSTRREDRLMLLANVDQGL